MSQLVMERHVKAFLKDSKQRDITSLNTDLRSAFLFLFRRDGSERIFCGVPLVCEDCNVGILYIHGSQKVPKEVF